ncbi:hypothetical protein [Actinoplanes siamensis]|uniref:Uncharacterized protein n=1 Tax=Actinoplanes siamensis TaxID=1223317 RepID=A0A919N6P7_9ACTN|nr:hypothetical protein [Actinoplanes siamensis]GIF05326.1 hypothetical protein Asi03nite_28640 [Actinoplanes siamensis]
MDAQAARVNVARFLGNTALGAGSVVVLLGFVYGGTTAFQPYAVAALLVIVGVGLRLEAAIMDRR